MKKSILILSILGCFSYLNLKAMDCKEIYKKYFEGIHNYKFGMSVGLTKNFFGLADLFLLNFTPQKWATDFAKAIEYYVRPRECPEGCSERCCAEFIYKISAPNEYIDSAIQYLKDKGLNMKMLYKDETAIEYLEKLKR